MTSALRLRTVNFIAALKTGSDARGATAVDLVAAST
jgi:hypothetical protein